MSIFHYTRPSLFLGLALAANTFALDDIPVYLDAGCPNTGIPGSPAEGTAFTNVATVNNAKALPITCTEALTGSDAIHIQTSAGGWWYGNAKMSTDRGQSLKGYKELHFWAKNRATTEARFAINWQTASYMDGPAKEITLPASSNWTEITVPLADLVSDSIAGLRFGQAASNPPALDLLIDSVTVTDGTANHSLDLPASISNPRPATWPSTFLVGSFDNRSVGTSTKAAQAGGTYRYQYVMPETEAYYSRSGTGYVYDYIRESDSLGVKTAIVWYNLGKSGEGWSPVTTNLVSSTYMSQYFNRYDSTLRMMARAGQSDYMLVLEPDMYGFLLRGPQGVLGKPMEDPTLIPVNMDRANALSGKTWEANMRGWAQFMVSYARTKLPKGVIAGHMPNHWGVNIPGQVGQGRKEAHYISAMTIARFLNGFGKDGIGDVVFVEKSDHDAGHKPTNENWLWDSTGYSKYFLWTRALANQTKLPIVGWQVSEGNMGNVAAWKDDAVETFLAHPTWWTDAGFIGILFGAGNADCVNYGADSDGNWFIDRILAYSQAPLALPAVSSAISTGRKVNPGLQASVSKGSLHLSGWTGKAQVRLLDAAGKLLSSSELEAGQSLALGRLRGVVFVSVRQGASVRNASILIVP